MGDRPLSLSALLAELNDLLQLDHDAVQAYSLAIESAGDPGIRATLERFRADHERHIQELTLLIRERGGIPIQLPHLPTGLFKLAVQAAGAAGGDLQVITAFKANERQVHDRYRRAALRMLPDDVQRVVVAAAADEQRHYAWALETAESLGFRARSATGYAERAFELVHERAADAIESGERRAMQVAESTRRGLRASAERSPIGALLLALGTGVMAARFGGRRREP